MMLFPPVILVTCKHVFIRVYIDITSGVLLTCFHVNVKIGMTCTFCACSSNCYRGPKERANCRI